ncbi:hypothetical protein PC9H_010098 [Pleurotus ostreatus]|uniref:Uncharacterized protein n=1 Tax=Pleurotus ostreatus TaxID=5322 RepID=A0A8H6ZQB1_PLEOS|nr:uncharacterized protein PC9H_010098 [Pleurotus ostreatus]KAF7424787.1 hypothetical protein PC9H_010098 [Pleurotus ostreatus]
MTGPRGPGSGGVSGKGYSKRGMSVSRAKGVPTMVAEGECSVRLARPGMGMGLEGAGERSSGGDGEAGWIVVISWCYGYVDGRGGWQEAGDLGYEGYEEDGRGTYWGSGSRAATG